MTKYVSKTNKSVGLTEDFYNFVKNEAKLKNRSVAGQLEYWSRIGYIIEQSKNYKEIEAILNASKDIFKIVK